MHCVKLLWGFYFLINLFIFGFIFLGSRITMDGDWSHEIKSCLLLGRKTMTNLGSVLQSRGITLPRKVHILKAMVFPVVMCGCERRTIKKAECQRIDAFELWCWRRLLGASVRNSAHGKGHEEGGLAYAKAWSSLRKPPVPKHQP